MRITQTTIASTFLNNINDTRERINDEQTELASGKRVMKVSDDPVATNTILRLKAFLGNNAQYQKNNAQAQTQAEATESALSSFSDLMVSLKGVLSQATNGANTADYKTYSDQVDELLSQAVELGNTQSNGVYIFGGTNTKQQPFTLAADHSTVTANPNGITGTIQYPVNEGVTQTVNIDGQQAFQGTAIFELMINVKNELEAGQAPTTAESQSVDGFLSSVTAATGKAGAMIQDLDNNNTQLAAQQTQLQQLLSVQQDSDVAETTIKMNQDQLELQAALSSGASVLPKTLLDFLR